MCHLSDASYTKMIATKIVSVILACLYMCLIRHKTGNAPTIWVLSGFRCNETRKGRQARGQESGTGKEGKEKQSTGITQGTSLPWWCLLFINPLCSKYSTRMGTWWLLPVREKLGRMWFHKWGKWEFQRGHSHQIRNSGQECRLPCSFHVIAKHRVCVSVCGGSGVLRVIHPIPISPPLLKHTSMLFAKEVGCTGSKLTFSLPLSKLFSFGTCWKTGKMCSN